MSVFIPVENSFEVLNKGIATTFAGEASDNVAEDSPTVVNYTSPKPPNDMLAGNLVMPMVAAILRLRKDVCCRPSRKKKVRRK